MQTAIFAAGCFWGVEEIFRKQKGVIKTEVGYTGGHTEKPTYEDVCNKNTGHAEAVKVEFNPEEVSFETLVRLFWKSHNPTTANQQGPDIGTQYRSAIFYISDSERDIAMKIKKELEENKTFSKPIVTEIVPASTFYRAEEYHQQYFMKRGGGVCHF